LPVAARVEGGFTLGVGRAAQDAAGAACHSAAVVDGGAPAARPARFCTGGLIERVRGRISDPTAIASVRGLTLTAGEQRAPQQADTDQAKAGARHGDTMIGAFNLRG